MGIRQRRAESEIEMERRRAFDEVKGEPNVTGLRKDLQPLYDIYSKVEANSISEEQMASIRKESEVIRETIVKP